MRRRSGALGRRLWFACLRRLVLPCSIVPLRLWVASWRLCLPPEPSIAAIVRAPRVVVVTCHGMFLHLLSFASIFVAAGRRPVVLVSPSRDGDLLASLLSRFGVDSVRGTQGSRAIAGSREFLRAIERGGLGIVAIDGPRGPACVAKPGVLRLAAVADAHLVLAATTASAGFRLGSWDRAHVPLPGSTVTLDTSILPPPETKDCDRRLAEVELALLSSARSLRSPVLPPALITP